MTIQRMEHVGIVVKLARAFGLELDELLFQISSAVTDHRSADAEITA